LADNLLLSPDYAALAAYSKIRLTREAVAGGSACPPGTAGVIADCHSDGFGCEVEPEQPKFRVVTLYAQDLLPVA
jgi:hypothetical protein